MISAGCIDTNTAERQCQLGCEWQLLQTNYSKEHMPIDKKSMHPDEVFYNVDKDCVKKERDGGRIVEACMCRDDYCNIASSARFSEMTLISMTIISRLV